MAHQNRKSFYYGIGFLSIAIMYGQQAHAEPFMQFQASRIDVDLWFSLPEEGLGEIEYADINNSGTAAVVGAGDAFIYKNGITTRITDADWNFYSIRINNNDQISGRAYVLRDDSAPPLYRKYDDANYFYDNGSVQDIGSIRPIRINDNGQIIGQQGSGFLSYLNGTVSELAFPYGTTAVNSTNNAAGTDTNGKLFTYINGEKQVINYPTGTEQGTIYAINDNDQAVGGLLEERGHVQAFLLDKGLITMLGHLEGRYNSHANDINASGIIVGRADNGYFYGDRNDYYLSNPEAFIINNGAMTNLNWLLTPQDVEKGIRLTSALAINDSNFIVARGYEYKKNQYYRSGIYLLTPNPVPVPASVWLFLSGLSIFGALRRLARKA